MVKEIYQIKKDELLSNVDVSKGLTREEAKKRLEQDGENVLKETERKSVLSVFLGQFADLLVIILIVAAIISMISGNLESTIVIIAVIILNAILGTVQYVKAEKSLESLKALSSPHVKVLRDGIKQEILSKDVVKGDIVLLEAGDMIVADGRIVNNYSLQVNESSLTGESTNVDKKDMEISEALPLGDRVNMVYSGSLVTYGRATVLVTGTGMNTEMGKIAQLMNDTSQKKTPLQKSLDDFGKKLAIIIMIISCIVFALRLWQGQPIIDSLMFAVALAVAAIPEALSSIVTIVQAMGTRKMATENAIIKELKAVESLGSVSVICSDKTGTLTQNKMTVQEIYTDGKCIKPQELDFSKKTHEYLLYNAILNNDSTIKDGTGIGDPTEYCLLSMARQASYKEEGVNENYFRQNMERLEEIPFDSDRKLMSTRYIINDVSTVFTKGALDVLLDRTVNILTEDGIRKITEQDKENILNQNRIFSENGLRVLSFAYKELGNNESLVEVGENNYTFIGLVSMVDPPRPESIQAVADAQRAGIRPVMITGDHKVTATAIARQIGIFKDGDMALTGQELDKLTDDELAEILERVSVYARVSPENKIRIVEAWQKKGKIVSMTGDGVNDAPALKKAELGVAMGITGTEVSKDAAAMILVDDNFATIIKAVLNGRNVYRNILNAIQFLLSGNLAAIIVVLLCSVFALPTPFEPVHLLFINLLTDSLPALAIGMEPSDKNLLKNKPRDPKKGFLTGKFASLLFAYALPIACVTMVAFFCGYSISAMYASTFAFASLTLARLFHGFNCRSDRSIFSIKFLSNKWSLLAFLAGVILLLLVMIVPILNKLFTVAYLNIQQISLIVGLAFIPTFIIQIVKVIRDKLMGSI
ncbi:MAG: cation-translocating P-type ATPase [Spirochaetaceae bacterium]|nr:cation-translocating P-type ATPase [Spirochaetaceae bacterium]